MILSISINKFIQIVIIIMLDYITYSGVSTISLSFWLRPQNMLYILTLEYITYLGASAISLNFWLSWFLNMVLELIWQEVTGSNLNHPSFKEEYSAPMRIHPSSLMGSCVRGHIRIYNISWDLKHQLKLLVELIPWLSKNQLNQKFKLIVEAPRYVIL